MADVGEDIMNQIESLSSGCSQFSGENRQETDGISRCGERMCVHRVDTNDRAGGAPGDCIPCLEAGL